MRVAIVQTTNYIANKSKSYSVQFAAADEWQR